MGAFGKERLILTEPFGAPTSVVDLGMAIDKNGNKITSAGAEVYAVALDDFTQVDIDANAVNATKKKLTGVTLGTCRVLLEGTVANGDKLAVNANGKFVVATAGQSVAVIAREAGASGDLIEAFKQASLRQVASANIVALTDNSGGTPSDTLADVPAAYNEATLANQIASLAAKINAILTVLDAHGITL